MIPILVYLGVNSGISKLPRWLAVTISIWCDAWRGCLMGFSWPGILISYLWCVTTIQLLPPSSIFITSLKGTSDYFKMQFYSPYSTFLGRLQLSFPSSPFGNFIMPDINILHQSYGWKFQTESDLEIMYQPYGRDQFVLKERVMYPSYGWKLLGWK